MIAGSEWKWQKEEIDPVLTAVPEGKETRQKSESVAEVKFIRISSHRTSAEPDGRENVSHEGSPASLPISTPFPRNANPYLRMRSFSMPCARSVCSYFFSPI